MSKNNDTLVGQVLAGKYKILERLGRGGMAEVYLAEQKNLGRQVAIKLMHAFLMSDEDFLNRFKREARAMAALNHPHIASVYDFDTYGEDSYYLVMEYINGGTLKARLQELAQREERMPLAQVVGLITQTAEALAYAHTRGMVHRDIKPANIMLDKETGRAILTDFGIVKMLGGQAAAYTMTGALIGTPAYMSPEQALGKPGDTRVDIYSLGVLLFQMTTGKLPFDADTPLAVVMKHVNEPTPLPVNFNPDVAPDLQEIILKAMAKEPADRFQSAEELVAALRTVDVTNGQEMVAVPPPIAPTVQSTVFEPPTAGPPTAGPPTTVTGGSSPSEVTKLATPVEQTQVAATGEQTIMAADAVGTTRPTPDTPADTFTKNGRPLWQYAIGVLFLFLLVGGGAGAALGWFGGPGNGTDESQPVAVVDVDESTPTSTPTVTETAAGQEVGQETPDVVASAVAAVRLTEQAQVALYTATPTNTATPSATPTHTPTPDRTAQFLETCVNEAELVNHYTYNSPNFRTAWAGENFAMNWVLRNSGTCPWPAETRWVYLSGESFGYDDDGLPLAEEIVAGEEIELRTNFLAPATPRQYQSVWQLVNTADEPVSDPITYTVAVQLRATPTPTSTPTPVASPTPEQELEELNYIFQVLTCEYITTDWRCHVRITPFGGGGGPYTVLVFDRPEGQATEFRGGGPHNYFAIARRCAAFNANVRVIDDSQTPALTMERHLYLDPNNYFAGGCTLP